MTTPRRTFYPETDMPVLPKLLFVEDHALTRQLIPAMLHGAFRVGTAATMADALERAEAEMFDILLIDTNLGSGGSGIDLMGTLRSGPAYARVPMVACTAYAAFGDAERFLASGFDAYIAKPFTRHDLRRTLQSQLKTRASSAPIR